MVTLFLALIFQQAIAAEQPGFDVVETRSGQVISHRKWKEKNVALIDWDNPSRGQGAVGSCQSFAW